MPEVPEIDGEEAIFIVTFVEHGDGLICEAVGDLTEEKVRRIVVEALRDTANEIEEQFAHGNTH
jgi:hypothetical protein